ncbi:mechanosensitive ion channel family protein [Sphingobacterium sp. DN00404]|uniref:Mechanosensitive ion channel family protein n=1 Tax=Sphingobacterium micropteri TaxID=2763501 RepID=A0ABR7YQR1_9SPHI|nr:mechanosensitive ion channel family protein [Sphingobacterium micropteri]MBD1433685.1 mechanosensitive ion channel family protein [Sphingobacterium micropteri]
MSSIRLLFLFIAVYIGSTGSSMGQDTVVSLADTAAEISSKANDLLQIREQQKQDSLQRKKLETQLISLSTQGDNERQRLLQEINILRSRDSILYAKRKQAVDSLRTLNKGVPVVPFKDTLFTVYTQVGSYTPQERAAAVENRIRSLADNYKFDVDSLRLEQNETNWIVYWEDQMIASIGDEDAMWADLQTAQLANTYLQNIKDSIVQYREDTSLQKIALGVVFAVIIILAVALIISGIGKMIKWVKKRLLLLRGNLFQGFRIKGYELVSAKRQIKFIWTLLNFVKWILILTSVYLALPILLNLFPTTEGYAPILLGYFIKPIKDVAQAVVRYLPNLITILVICIIFRYLLKMLRFFAQEIHNGALNFPGFYKEWALPTYQIVRVLLFAFLLIIIFPYFPGADTPIFKGVSVFIGVLFTFSSAGALGNIIAGLLLTYMRSFSIGDRVKIGDVSGDIIEKSLLVTRIRTIKNEVISVPNSQVMNSHTINYSMDVEANPLIVYTHITMAYEIPWQQVHELAKKACEQVDLLEKTPAPFILQTSLDDFYVTYQINAYTRNPHKQAAIYSELHKHVLDVFHAAGIELLSPHFRAVRDGSELDMPTAFKKDKDIPKQ